MSIPLYYDLSTLEWFKSSFAFAFSLTSPQDTWTENQLFFGFKSNIQLLTLIRAWIPLISKGTGCYISLVSLQQLLYLLFLDHAVRVDISIDLSFYVAIVSRNAAETINFPSLLLTTLLSREGSSKKLLIRIRQNT